MNSFNTHMCIKFNYFISSARNLTRQPIRNLSMWILSIIYYYIFEINNRWGCTITITRSRTNKLYKTYYFSNIQNGSHLETFKPILHITSLTEIVCQKQWSKFCYVLFNGLVAVTVIYSHTQFYTKRKFVLLSINKSITSLIQLIWEMITYPWGSENKNCSRKPLINWETLIYYSFWQHLTNILQKRILLPS